MFGRINHSFWNLWLPSKFVTYFNILFPLGVAQGNKWTTRHRAKRNGLVMFRSDLVTQHSDRVTHQSRPILFSLQQSHARINVQIPYRTYQSLQNYISFFLFRCVIGKIRVRVGAMCGCDLWAHVCVWLACIKKDTCVSASILHILMQVLVWFKQ